MKSAHVVSLFSVMALAFACGSESSTFGVGSTSSSGAAGSSNGGFGTVLEAIQESADGCKDGGGFVNPVK